MLPKPCVGGSSPLGDTQPDLHKRLDRDLGLPRRAVNVVRIATMMAMSAGGRARKEAAWKHPAAAERLPASPCLRGYDPLTGHRHYLEETVPVGPKAGPEAERVRIRFLAGRRAAQPHHQGDGQPDHGPVPGGSGRRADDADQVRRHHPQPHPARAEAAGRQPTRRGPAEPLLRPAANLPGTVRREAIHRAPNRTPARVRRPVRPAQVPGPGVLLDPGHPLRPQLGAFPGGAVALGQLQPIEAAKAPPPERAAANCAH